MDKLNTIKTSSAGHPLSGNSISARIGLSRLGELYFENYNG